MDDLLQFKSLSDLQNIIQKLEKLLAEQGKRKLLSRPIADGNHPTLYAERKKGEYRTVMGIRICDYKFSEDERWVLPDDQWGLSFSSTWDNLQRVYKIVSRFEDKKRDTRKTDIYWTFSKKDLPSGMKFVQDRAPGKQGHYFLAVVGEQMRVSTLRDNLIYIAGKMSIIKDGSIGL